MKTLSVLFIFGLLFLNACSSSPEDPASDMQADASQESAQPEVLDATTDASATENAENMADTTSKANVEQAVDAIVETEITCTGSKEDVRRISIVRAEDKLCSVIYEKNGQQTEVAWANNIADYCVEVKDRMQNKLAGAGFTCTEGK